MNTEESNKCPHGFHHTTCGHCIMEGSTGVISIPSWIDPATGKPHRNDHICNHQCLRLKAEAVKKVRDKRGMETAVRGVLLAHTAYYYVVYRGQGKETIAACVDPECGFEGTALEHVDHVAKLITELIADA